MPTPRMTRRMITPRVHLMLDVATVAVFLVAPRLLHLAAGPRALAYLLATAHALLTVTMESMPSQFLRVGGRIHAGVELVVGLALLAVPLVTGWSAAAHWFFGVAGCAILAVVAGTDYAGRSRFATSS